MYTEKINMDGDLFTVQHGGISLENGMPEIPNEMKMVLYVAEEMDCLNSFSHREMFINGEGSVNIPKETISKRLNIPSVDEGRTVEYSISRQGASFRMEDVSVDVLHGNEQIHIYTKDGYLKKISVVGTSLYHKYPIFQIVIAWLRLAIGMDFLIINDPVHGGHWIFTAVNDGHEAEAKGQWIKKLEV